LTIAFLSEYYPTFVVILGNSMQRGEQALAWRATAFAKAGVDSRPLEVDLRGFDIETLVRKQLKLAWSGRIDMFGRLVDLLHSQALGERAAQVVVEAAGRIERVAGASDRRLLDLRVCTRSALVCQSCLGPVDWTVDSAIVLELVDDESILGEFPDPDDPCEQVLSSSRFDLASVIEDELLLCMPPIPRHEKCPGEQPPDRPESSGEKRPSPFAVLAQLKTDGQSRPS
jgi:uncharacterized protein